MPDGPSTPSKTPDGWAISAADKLDILRITEDMARLLRAHNVTPAVALTACCRTAGMVIGKTRRLNATAAVGMAEIATNMVPLYANAYTRGPNPLVD